jgi:hypothetical protein
MHHSPQYERTACNKGNDATKSRFGDVMESWLASPPLEYTAGSLAVDDSER